MKRAWLERQSAGRVLDVTSPRYGARGDGRADDTMAVQDAVSDALPGDTVLLPGRRTYLIDAVDLGEAAPPKLALQCHEAVIRKHPEGRFGSTNSEHLFFDRRGACDGLRVLGGRFELSRHAATVGDTASAFFLVRVDDVFFGHVEIVEGIEEGAKLYKCRNVTWASPRISGCRNNGIQCHAPVRDEYEGDKENRGWAGWRIYGGRVRGIDDGFLGTEDGQGITFNSTDPSAACDDAVVEGVEIEGCNRGLWAEFNHRDLGARRIHFRNNVVRRSAWHGIGQVGVIDGRIAGNHVLDTGFRAPGPDSSSEVVGIVVSGNAEGRAQRPVVAGNTVRDDRPDPWMQYGVVVRQAEDAVVERNTVSGAGASAYKIEATASGSFDAGTR